MSAASRAAIEKQIEECVRPIVQSGGLDLVDVEVLGPEGRRLLRITIDKEGGVSHADCVAVSRQVDPLLDVKDWIQGSYNLEVSSPGLNRPLKRDKDFLRFRGRLVSVRTHEPLLEGDKRRQFRGRLTAFDGGTIQIEVEGGDRVEIPLGKVARAQLEVEW